MKPILYDAGIIGCVSADIGLILFLFNAVFLPDLDDIFLFLVPIIIFAIALLVAQRRTLFQRKSKSAVLLQTAGIGMMSEETKLAISEAEKKKFKPSPKPEARPEFASHNCPEHGPERCAGNYMNLHSCNTPSNSATQLYWEEKSPTPLRKTKRKNSSTIP